MTAVAVVAHGRKTLGGGLDELRSRLVEHGIDADWHVVRKSKQAPAAVRRALHDGADLILVWGGDGTVQRCIDAAAHQGAAIGILPAGTANLLATNLGIPIDLGGALGVALHGHRRALDVGVINGERFAVMAGIGFDAEMIRRADRGLKDKAGRIAYVYTGLKAVRTPPCRMEVKVDGTPWFRGEATCILVGNVGTATGGLRPFPEAEPDDGVLEIGVVTARRAVQWGEVIARMARGHADRSKHTRTTRGRKVSVRLDRKTVYELDGGARGSTKKLKIKIEPAAISICVPDPCTPAAGAGA